MRRVRGERAARTYPVDGVLPRQVRRSQPAPGTSIEPFQEGRVRDARGEDARRCRASSERPQEPGRRRDTRRHAARSQAGRANGRRRDHRASPRRPRDCRRARFSRASRDGARSRADAAIDPKFAPVSTRIGTSRSCQRPVTTIVPNDGSSRAQPAPRATGARARCCAGRSPSNRRTRSRTRKRETAWSRPLFWK